MTAFEMELDEEMYPAVRPKRQTRQPARLQDYEVDYVGYRQRDLSQWGLPSPTTEGRVFQPREGPVQMTPFQASQTHSGSFHGDAAHHEIFQLAPGRIQRRDLDSGARPEHTPAPSYQQSLHLDYRLQEEIRVIQEENARPLQSQQVFQSGLKELNEVRSEMKELIEVARSLRVDMSQPHSPAPQYSTPQASAVASRSCPAITAPKEEEEEYWPDPPPWPEPEEDLQSGMCHLKLEAQEPLGLHLACGHLTPRHQLLDLNKCIEAQNPLFQSSFTQIPRADFRRHQFKQPGATQTLYNLSEWLRYESWCQGFDSQATGRGSKERQNPKTDGRSGKQMVTVLHGTRESPENASLRYKESSAKDKAKSKAYCAYCESTEHYLSQCSDIIKLSKDQLKEWILVNKRCWRCARKHQAAQCTLKKPCNLCQGKHLLALHEINTRSERASKDVAVKEESCLTSSASDSLYLDRPEAGNRVMLKVVPVIVQYGERTLDTFAILDDGSERTMLLPAAAKSLGMKGTPEALPLRTVRQDIQVLHGHTVSFRVFPAGNPQTGYTIDGAFTASRLSLAQHTYPIDRLQKKFKHLRGIPIPPLREAKPSLLIGSDQPHLVTPVEPVRLSPPGGPAAVHTRLGWTLQGPMQFMGRPAHSAQCLFTSSPPLIDELYKHVERLWQVDTVPYRLEREVTRSKQDQQAVAMLEAKTVRTKVDGILRYATPLLRHANMPTLHAPKESVMPMLRSTERRLLRDPKQADAYKKEMQKLIGAGAVQEVDQETSSKEGWYIPHHLVSHNGKNRLVFNCSHQYLGQTLNQYLLPGPTLGASLLGVLVRFREYPIAVSGDIKGMFHQVRLRPDDRPLLRFLWRDLKVDQPPRTFEWQVLPFGTTCSPCCAIYALQRHVVDHSQPDDELRFSVEKCFYVDNCLQSVRTPGEAKLLVDQLRDLLASAGFELRQWACNDPSVLSHLPREARSESLDLWLAQNKSDPLESTLGLSWNWETDCFGYKHRPVAYEAPTLRNLYRVLASQYDPLGYLLPFTTRAKLIIRQLWDKQRGWDDSNLPPELLRAWSSWEAELESLPLLIFPRVYVPADINLGSATREVHIFADASEQAYGAVAYMRTEDKEGRTHLSFLFARSRVAPLYPALRALWGSCGSAAGLCPEERTYCDSGSHCVVVRLHNRANLATLSVLPSPEAWPERPSTEALEDTAELRKATFCGVTVTSPTSTSLDDKVYNTWQELMDATRSRTQWADPCQFSAYC
ncbi:hypothetical protein SKAU_G00025890 [Synaphobranchus kaupii]|uniref:ribonuclease H n=1 Tax=Synaphobranchus kaupii TaxID=118154 RepID=A0A9Q1GCP2_SYNKA|nr:hypothetical protein SKAU_G00025890 [Synaphobranchus kaupii]